MPFDPNSEDSFQPEHEYLEKTPDPCERDPETPPVIQRNDGGRNKRNKAQWKTDKRPVYKRR